MSKIVRVDFPPFTGTVAMPDYLTLPQVLAYEDAIADLSEMRESGKKLTLSKINAYNLPVILSIVSEWHIERVPDVVTFDIFPCTPRLASAQFIAQIMNEITALYNGEIDIPNA